MPERIVADAFLTPVRLAYHPSAVRRMAPVARGRASGASRRLA